MKIVNLRAYIEWVYMYAHILPIFIVVAAGGEDWPRCQGEGGGDGQ